MSYYDVKENDCLNEESLSFSSHKEYFRGREIFIAGSGRVRAEMSPHFYSMNEGLRRTSQNSQENEKNSKKEVE